MLPSLAVVASVASAATPYVRVAQSDVYYGGLGPVQGFTYPQMGGEKGDQVEAASYTNTDYFLGVFDTGGSGLVAGVNSSTPVAAGSLKGFGDFSVSRGNPLPSGDPVMAFISSTSSYDGLFVQLPGGKVVPVATTKDAYGPAGGEVFNLLANPSVELSQDLSTIFVSFSARTGSYAYGWRGIILASLPVDGSSVSLTLVVDNAMTMPVSGAAFTCIDGSNVNSKGDVYFFGSQCGSNGVSAMVTNQFNSLMMYNGQRVFRDALTKDRQLAVSGLHAGIWEWSKGSISAVANAETRVPGGSSTSRFTAFSNPGVGLDGTVSFVARGTEDYNYGIYKMTSAGLAVVVDMYTDVPGYSGCKFSYFPQPPSVDSSGNVVFFGQCDETVAGVFTETSSGLGTIVTYDDKIDGYSTVYVGFGSNSVSGGKAAMYIMLSDTNQTNGIWVFDVPTSGDASLV